MGARDEDEDDFAQELLELGVDESQIDAARSRAAGLDGDSDSDDVVVWRENVPAVQVYSHCRWTITTVAGMSGGMRLYEGISAQEIKAVCDLLDLPPGIRPDVIAGVRVIEKVAAQILNQKGG